jgi:hypothetical protein
MQPACGVTAMKEGSLTTMKKISLLLAVAVCLGSGTARAQNALIDFQGYAYETGGFPVSDPGDTLRIVGVVDDIDSRFGVNLGSEEVTLFVNNLISTGQVDLGGGLLSIAYTDGGNIDLYRDPAMDHDYGINPPNGTAPSTFVNGSLLLGGTLNSFFLFLDTASGTGAYEANVVFTSGSGLATLGQLNASGYTFGGVFTTSAGASVPEGYDLQVDGVIEVEVVVGVEQSSWSAVKGLFKGSR